MALTQDGVTDPQAALKNHLKVNKPANDSHLFSFKHKDSMRLMSRNILITRINKIAATKKIPKLPGHGIHVRSTVEYLKCGIPFDVVKAKGRWQSDAFRGYLRDHANIMAPYIQANPTALDTLFRYTMPPVC